MNKEENESKKVRNNDFEVFISSYFSWVSLPHQKERVEELQNITKKKENT